jgi:hypothetical protein
VSVVIPVRDGDDSAPNAGEPWFPFSVSYVSHAPVVTPPETIKSTKAPRISGKARVGSRLRCSSGTWTGAPKLTYAWKRNGKTLKGATTNRYKVRKRDRRAKLTCTVKGGSQTVRSKAVRVK